MKRETKTVWRTDNGEQLMESTGTPNEVYIHCSTIDEEKARALRDALTDFLDEPVVAAVKRANTAKPKSSEDPAF